MAYTVAAFYQFFPFSDYMSWRAPLKERMRQSGIRGTILLAPEGINSTLAGSKEAVAELLAYLRTHPGMHDMEVKEHVSDAIPFARAKVKLKKEIIALGRPVSPLQRTGQYADAAAWNALIADPATYVLDTRNAYEVEKGTFERAINPHIRTFKELTGFIEQHLDPEKHTRIATFCTGGIRCEKLTSWLLEKGFPEVYQLQGGILKYMQEMPADESRWQGECFVFDERGAV